MPVRAEVTQEPGLIELLSQEQQPVSDSRIVAALNEFRGSLANADMRDAEALNEMPGQPTDWWHTLRDWFTGERHEIVGQAEAPLELQAYWLTLPDVPAASVKLTVAVEASDETSASLTILGIGGGPTFTLDIKEALEHQASEPERVSLFAPGTFEKVRVMRGGEEVFEYARLVSLDRTNLEWTFAAAKPTDVALCGPQMSSKKVGASASSGTTTMTLNISRGTKWEFGADLSFEKLGLGAKLAASITYTRDVGFEYVLPGRYDYVATRYEDFPAYLWTTTTA
jgi:hypothetical protein